MTGLTHKLEINLWSFIEENDLDAVKVTINAIEQLAEIKSNKPSTSVVYIPSMQAQGTHGRSFLHYAIERKHVDVASYLLDYHINHRHDDILKLITINRRQTLIHVMIESGDAFLPLLEIMLSKNNTVLKLINCVDSNGRTPLFYAIELSKVKFVTLLLQQGARIDIKDNDNFSILMAAANTTDDNLVTQLMTEFPVCAKYVDDCDLNGNTLLHRACKQMNADMVELLLSYHLNPHKTNLDNVSPLDYFMRNVIMIDNSLHDNAKKIILSLNKHGAFIGLNLPIDYAKHINKIYSILGRDIEQLVLLDANVNGIPLKSVKIAKNLTASFLIDIYRNQQVNPPSDGLTLDILSIERRCEEVLRDPKRADIIKIQTHLFYRQYLKSKSLTESIIFLVNTPLFFNKVQKIYYHKAKDKYKFPILSADLLNQLPLLSETFDSKNGKISNQEINTNTLILSYHEQRAFVIDVHYRLLKFTTKLENNIHHFSHRIRMIGLNYCILIFVASVVPCAIASICTMIYVADMNVKNRNKDVYQPSKEELDAEIKQLRKLIAMTFPIGGGLILLSLIPFAILMLVAVKNKITYSINLRANLDHLHICLNDLATIKGFLTPDYQSLTAFSELLARLSNDTSVDAIKNDIADILPLLNDMRDDYNIKLSTIDEPVNQVTDEQIIDIIQVPDLIEMEEEKDTLEMVSLQLDEEVPLLPPKRLR